MGVGRDFMFCFVMYLLRFQPLERGAQLFHLCFSSHCECLVARLNFYDFFRVGLSP